MGGGEGGKGARKGARKKESLRERFSSSMEWFISIPASTTGPDPKGTDLLGPSLRGRAMGVGECLRGSDGLGPSSPDRPIIASHADFPVAVEPPTGPAKKAISEASPSPSGFCPLRDSWLRGGDRIALVSPRA